MCNPAGVIRAHYKAILFLSSAIENGKHAIVKNLLVFVCKIVY